MGDEVTKKDLQSLQGQFNKQMADLTKRIVKSEGDIAVLKDVPTEQDDVLAKLLQSRCDLLQKRIIEVQVQVDVLKQKCG